MKRKAISVLLCAALLLSVCVPGMLAFQASGEETVPEGQTSATEESATVETASPPTETEADPTEAEAAPTDPETVPTGETEPTETQICPECGQAEGHEADCPHFVPEETEDPFDPEEARLILLASASLEEANAFFSTLTEEQAEALFAILTEEDFHELAANLGLLEDRGSVTPPKNYTRVGPLKPPVNVSPRLMMGPRTEAPENGLILSKAAEPVPGTDTYKITMEAYTTGEVISSQRSLPTDIVLVLDESGSMRDRITDYKAVYDLDRGKSYYVKRGNAYAEVKWCNSPPWLLVDPHDPGWYTGEPNVHTFWHTRYDPMTSQEDTTPGHVQFYELAYRRESKYQVLMDEALRFANKVKADAEANNVDHRISVIGFSNSSHIKIGLEMDIRDNLAAVETAINTLGADGGTYIEQGLGNAIRVFDSAAPTSATLRNRVVIVFTDGIPGNGSWNDTTIRGSANPAIEYAHTLKNEYGATVYSIGMLEGADPTLPISDDTSDSARTNKFLHYLSSNYPNATSMSSGGSGSNAGYYLSASDTASLNEIFTKISQGIGTPTISLGSETQIRDIVSPYFTMPADTSEIRLFTAEYNGSSFGGRVPLTGAGVSVEEDSRTVTVTGFDFNGNFVSETPKSDGTYGKKLIIEFTVRPREGFLGGNGVPTNGESSGVYDKDGSIVETFPLPTVDVPIPEITVRVEDKNIYLLGSLSEDQLKEGAVSTANGTDLFAEDLGWKADFVTVSHTFTGPDGNLTEDGSYTLRTAIVPKTGAGGQSGTAVGQIYVFKPEVTFRDTCLNYGEAPNYINISAPNCNLVDVAWKHGGVSSESVVMIGAAPALDYSFHPNVTSLTQETPVQVIDVQFGGTSVMEHVTFCRDGCGYCEHTGKARVDMSEEGYVNFILHLCTFDLTIIKTGTQPIDENQAYLFHVSGNGIELDVVIEGDGSVTVKDLPSGSYTVTERTGWSWRYTPDAAAQTASAEENRLIFVNTRASLSGGVWKWLNGDAYSRNFFDRPPDNG